MRNVFLLGMLLCVHFISSSYGTPTYTLIVFEGSDWCGNCRRLEKNILEDSVFQNYLSQKDIVIEKIDFPQRKQLPKAQESYNASVAEQYNFKGAFPTLVLVDHVHSKFYTLTYANESVDQMVSKLQEEIGHSK